MSKHYAYGGNPPGMAGRYHWGGGGLGMLGSALAVDGYLYPSLSLPADADKEYYAVLGAIPAGLTFDDSEFGDYEASANDGQYVIPLDIYEWGVKLAPQVSLTLKFGNVSTVNLVIANMASNATLGTVAVSVSPPDVGAGQSFNYVRFTLQGADDVPLVNLVGLKYALFAQATPDVFGAPVSKGALESTDGSAICEIPVPASTVPPGRYWLVLTDSDGTTTQDPPARSVSCPVMVV